NLDPATTPEVYHAACQALASAGHRLYNRVFTPAARQQKHARSVYKWLRSLAANNDPIEVLEIVIQDESPWSIPWTLLYEDDTGPGDFPRREGRGALWDPFWGFGYTWGGGGRVEFLRRRPLVARPKVLLITAPAVLTAADQQNLAFLKDCCALTTASTRSD